jgi:hypothetical protein
MPIRRLALDVDKVIDRPDMISLAQQLEAVPGVTGVNLTVTEIDIETVGLDVTIDGDDIDTQALFTAITEAGAVLHSVDQVIAGNHIVDHVIRRR